jgi:Zn-dependent protease with chaperone function
VTGKESIVDAVALPLICPHGHGPGAAGSLFCTLCGTQLVPAPAPQPATGFQPTASAPQPVPAGAPFPSAHSISALSPFAHTAPPPVCKLCGGGGLRLSPSDDICTECGWLRPLFPGYALDRTVFLWAQDGQAMNTLHNMSVLNAVARTVSDKVGRPWIEATYNGIRIGPNQLPHVWKLAVLAARLLGVPYMPDVYVSGDSMWNTYTFGSDKSSFIVLGTAILTNFHDDDLLFVLAREMGHCRAGHALWKTVIRFVAGDISGHTGLLSGGMLSAISPTKLIGGALEMPLMAWSRQSEVTADRAGLLAIGDVALARRVLLTWSIRSATLLKQVNIEEWMKQEDASADNLTHISEMTMASTMYTARRLRFLGLAAREPGLMQWSEKIQPARKQLSAALMPAPKPAPAPSGAPSEPGSPASSAGWGGKLGLGGPAAPKDSIRVVCNKCQNAMRIPFAALRGKASLNVRCPQCQNIMTLRSKPTTPSPAPAGPQK